MQSANITPNRTSTSSPVHARDAIMIPRDQPHHIIPNHLLLVRIQAINLADMQTDAGEQTLPAGNRMCANDGMVWSEFEVFVQRRTSGAHNLVLAGFTC